MIFCSRCHAQHKPACQVRQEAIYSPSPGTSNQCLFISLRTFDIQIPSLHNKRWQPGAVKGFETCHISSLMEHPGDVQNTRQETLRPQTLRKQSRGVPRGCAIPNKLKLKVSLGSLTTHHRRRPRRPTSSHLMFDSLTPGVGRRKCSVVSGRSAGAAALYDRPKTNHDKCLERQERWIVKGRKIWGVVSPLF